MAAATQGPPITDHIRVKANAQISLWMVRRAPATLWSADQTGWALTLLSTPNLSYASTAQTIGLGVGNALAFTVFLAFNSSEFS